jgi:hypothetical protein
MPVEVMSEFAVDADEVADDEDEDEPVDVLLVGVVVGVVDVLLEMVELMSPYVLSQVANLSALRTGT